MSYLLDFTAPERHDRLHDRLAASAGSPVPDAPHMPGCERIDVYLRQRWPELGLDPEDVEIRDMVTNLATGMEGWAVYVCGTDDSYWSARRIGFLQPNERPVMVGGFMHITVMHDGVVPGVPYPIRACGERHKATCQEQHP